MLSEKCGDLHGVHNGKNRPNFLQFWRKELRTAFPVSTAGNGRGRVRRRAGSTLGRISPTWFQYFCTSTYKSCTFSGIELFYRAAAKFALEISSVLDMMRMARNF